MKARASTAALVTLLLLALAMQVRGPLFWYGLASRSETYLHLPDRMWLPYAVQGAIILVLGVLAIRGSRIPIVLLALLMAWHARGSFMTARGLGLGGPGEREIALWALRSSVLYLLLAGAFATFFVVAAVKARRGRTTESRPPGGAAPDPSVLRTPPA